SPVVNTRSASALGLTQIQSNPLGAGRVPLVSTAILKLRACNAAMSASSICNSGSPPVHTTKRALLPLPFHVPVIASASASAVANLPPPIPSVPTNSVSQNLHTALLRSFSSPDHRLHPAKRQNTAGRPALAPSPCSV